MVILRLNQIQPDGVVVGVLVMLSITVLLCPAEAYGDNAAVDADASMIVLNAEEVIEQVRQNTDVLLIDTRVMADRREGYIEGSISIPLSQLECDTLKHVAKQQIQPIIFYCSNDMCGAIRSPLQIAQSCGYKNLSWFKGGYHSWRIGKYPIQKILE